MAVIDSAVLLLQAKNYSGTGDWLDESGNSHDAQLGSTSGSDTNDPTFNSSPPYFALTSDDYFIVTDHADLDFSDTQDFTVMILLRPDDWATSSLWLDKRQDANFGWLFVQYASNYYTAWVGDDSTTLTDDVANVSGDGDLAVFTMRADRTAEELEGFEDGTGSGTPTDLTGHGTLVNSGDLYIGSDFVGGSPFEGDIHAVAVWRSALSDADIATAGSELTGTVETVIRPIADTAGTGWDSAPTGSQSLYAQVDEETPSDTDYIYAEDPNP